jgi:carbon-monoxide dehydrogenase medium subunit
MPLPLRRQRPPSSRSARISGFHGERTIPLESFFTGPGTTVLQAGELLVEILLPDSMATMGSAYIKHCPRGAMDVAIVGVAVVVRLSPDGGKVEECRIGLGAVAPTPLRVKGAEALLQGEKPTARLVQAVAQKAAEECSPVSDIRGSDEYRRRMVAVLTARALVMALERAHGTGINRG